jgi:hypothetical protein
MRRRISVRLSEVKLITNRSSLSPSAILPTVAALSALAGATVLCGCTLDPQVPAPILSRLAPGQAGAAPAPQLSAAEKQRYDAIDKQVMEEQNQAMAADAWARYYGPYYATPYYYPAPVVYGGYSSGWSTGIGFGYGSPGWWW